MPTTGQIILLYVAIALFAAGGIVSVVRGRRDGAGLRAAARACIVAGIVASIGVLVWHAVLRGQWVPLGDNFDALIWLGTLLALFVLYVQATRPLGALEWFVMPVVVLLLVAAAVFGRERYHDYVNTPWSWLHRVTAYGGAVAFAIAAASGAMYVLASRKLRT